MRIIDFFDQGVAYHNENVAFVDSHTAYTFGEADAEIHKLAAAIHGNGFGKGTRVGVYAPNSNKAWIAMLGLMRAEGVWLPINPRNSVSTNIDLAGRFGMELLLYSSSFNELVLEIKENVPSIKQFVCIDGEGSVGLSLNEFCDGHPAFHQIGPPSTNELAAIFPTGGTTGKSKGVLMGHESLETMAANYFSHLNYRENSVSLIVAPMTHTAGILGALHFPRGGKNVITKHVDPLSIMQDIEEHKVTHLFLPPTVLYMMLSHQDVTNYDYSSLQHFMLGAAPTSFEKLKEAVQVFGPVMTEIYGQVEAPASICIKAPDDYLKPDGSIDEARLKGIGRPGVFNQVKILDNDGQEVPQGVAGEICVSGRLVTQGYLNNRDANTESYKDGWLWTGDIGRMNHDGYIEIVDRRKDLIITGGFNVYPNEVEQAICGHPDVHECAVIGIPDEKWGEAVKGVVVLKPLTSVSAEEIIAMVKDALGSVKAPKTIDFVADLPRSPNGKVIKTEIRKQYWQDQERAVN